jgi:(S)-ureidoglycine aminohydrolase
MRKTRYFDAPGGLASQDALMTGRAIFTEAYAVIPKGVFSDITASRLPGWEDTRLWVMARPLSGFAETFSQYLMEVSPGGGSDTPEPDIGAEAALFFVSGEAKLFINNVEHKMSAGGFAYLPADCSWQLWAEGDTKTRFHWIRKRYEVVPGLDKPEPLISSDQDIVPQPMPETAGRWSTTLFIDPADMRHDMHVTVVTLEPGGVIPFEETHVMEHGLYVLEGKGVYKLNQDWVEVEAGDFMWLRAFCPQACYAGGSVPFRYLLYKDVNRHARL